MTPYLESALMDLADRAWPEEYPVPVSNKEKVWDGYFHPSMHASAPALYLYYEFHPDYHLVPPRFTTKDILTFQIGSAMHAVVQNLFIHLGMAKLEDIEWRFRDEVNLCTGQLDIARVSLPSGVEPVVEIKSAGWLPRKPYPQHVDQGIVYGHQRKADVVSLLYFEKKQPHEFREFVLKMEDHQDRLREIYTKWRRVREAVQFSDPAYLENCCEPDSPTHLACPARNVCRIGKPSVVMGKRG